MIDFRKLISAGSHFGHQVARWCPKMAPYIWGHKNKVHLIDVSKTAFQLEKAAEFLHGVASEGKQILWVGTKRSAQKAIVDVATDLSMPFVNHRWIGGTLSNYAQVKKSVTKLLHYEDILSRAEKFSFYTKKEFNTFSKVAGRLDKSVGGIRTLVWPIGAIVIVDVSKEESALREAMMMGVPVVAIVDTNSDPSYVDYPIPANDDAPASVALILSYLAEFVTTGKVKAAANAEVKAEQDKLQKQQEALLNAKEISMSGTTGLLLDDEQDSDGAKKSAPGSRSSRPRRTTGASDDTSGDRTASRPRPTAPAGGVKRREDQPPRDRAPKAPVKK